MRLSNIGQTYKNEASLYASEHTHEVEYYYVMFKFTSLSEITDFHRDVEYWCYSTMLITSDRYFSIRFNSVYFTHEEDRVLFLLKWM